MSWSSIHNALPWVVTGSVSGSSAAAAIPQGPKLQVSGEVGRPRRTPREKSCGDKVFFYLGIRKGRLRHIRRSTRGSTKILSAVQTGVYPYPPIYSCGRTISHIDHMYSSNSGQKEFVIVSTDSKASTTKTLIYRGKTAQYINREEMKPVA